jgi:hypothetical protein
LHAKHRGWLVAANAEHHHLHSADREGRQQHRDARAADKATFAGLSTSQRPKEVATCGDGGPNALIHLARNFYLCSYAHHGARWATARYGISHL